MCSLGYVVDQKVDLSLATIGAYYGDFHAIAEGKGTFRALAHKRGAMRVV